MFANYFLVEKIHVLKGDKIKTKQFLQSYLPESVSIQLKVKGPLKAMNALKYSALENF